MLKLVVLLSFLAVVTVAKPSQIVAPLAQVATATSYQSRTDIINKPVVAYTPILAAPAPAQVVPLKTIAEKTEEEVKQGEVKVEQVQEGSVHTVEAPTVIAARLAALPVAYTQNIHYAPRDVLTGYTSEIIKPNLGAFQGTLVYNAPLTRTVQTITPTITKVEPLVEVKPPVVAQTYAAPVVKAEKIELAPQQQVEVKSLPVLTYAAPYAYAAPAGHVFYSAPLVHAPIAYSHNLVTPSATYTAKYQAGVSVEQA